MRTRIITFAAVLTLALPAVAQADDADGWYDVPATGELVTELAPGAAAPAVEPRAGDTGTTGEEPPPVEEPVIAAGVTVARIPVEGLTEPAALALLETEFARKINLRVGRKRFLIAPGQLGLRANLASAVRKALAATAPGNVYVPISYDKAKLKSLQDYLVERTAIPARDASWVARTVPRLRKEVIGQRLDARKLKKRLVLSLSRPLTRKRPRVVRDAVVPAVRNNEVGPFITISRDDKLLTYWVATRKGRVQRAKRFGVATGQSSYPTPRGLREVVEMWANPWWYPPDSDWAAGAQPIPPGPGNPLGTRWMGISSPNDRHPRDARRGEHRLLRLARLHPHADPGRRVGLRARLRRRARPHLLDLVGADAQASARRQRA